MKKKLIMIMFVLGIVLTTLTSTYAAESFFNMGMFETAYKLSKEADINLPFINLFSKSAIYDKNVKHSGISFGESTIDVNEKLEGVHLIFSTDMVTIKGEVEHGFIYGNNVVIEGKISGDSVIIGNTVKILDTAVIERDVIIVADSLEMAGTVNGHLLGSVQNADIKGKVIGDLRLDAARVVLDGTVEGDIHITVLKEHIDELDGVKEKYPNAIITERVIAEKTELSGKAIAGIVYKGLVVVAVYTVATILITKKENNIVRVASARFKEYTFFGILLGALMWLGLVVIPILLLLLALFGLEMITLPILVMYLGLLLLTLSISSLVVGATVFEIVKSKVGKFKIPVAALIFAVIYALSQITAISMYVWIIKNLLAVAIILTYIFKKEGYGTEVVEAKTKKKK